jgi:hypothetical protein
MHTHKVFWYRMLDGTDRYGVSVKRIADGRSTSSCSGIANEALARDCASVYAWSYAVDRVPAPVERIRTAAEPLSMAELALATGAL